MVTSHLHVSPSFGHMPVFSKHSCYQKNPFSMVSVCVGVKQDQNLVEICWGSF